MSRKSVPVGSSEEFSVGAHEEGENADAIPEVQDLLPAAPAVPPVVVPRPDADGKVDFAAMMAAMTAGISQGIAAGMQGMLPKQKVEFGDFDPKSPFDIVVNGKSLPRPELRRVTYQNGFRIMPERMTHREIELCNQLRKSGRYINRVVELVVRDEGAAEVVYINYNNRSIEQRFENKGLWRSFEDLLQQIVNAQDEVVLA